MARNSFTFTIIFKCQMFTIGNVNIAKFLLYYLPQDMYHSTDWTGHGLD